MAFEGVDVLGPLHPAGFIHDARGRGATMRDAAEALGHSRSGSVRLDADALAETFERMDANRTRHIELDELTDALDSLGLLSEAWIGFGLPADREERSRRVFAAFDSDADGRISYEDYERLVAELRGLRDALIDVRDRVGRIFGDAPKDEMRRNQRDSEFAEASSNWGE